MNEIIVHKGRTNTFEFDFAHDLSQDIITSQIRAGRTETSSLIAEWDVRFKTDGQNGTLILTLGSAVTSQITNVVGYMDFKRISAGQPVSMLDGPIRVMFKRVVTK